MSGCQAWELYGWSSGFNFIKGYLKATDLSVAKQLVNKYDGSVNRNATIMGTPHYTAPEVILGKCYSF